jgi:hypothetical protein
MKKRLWSILLLAYISLPALSQDIPNNQNDHTTPSPGEAKIDSVYQIISLENFESSVFSNKNLKFSATSNRKCQLAVADDFPSPEKNSRKYLKVTLFANHHDIAVITPPDNIRISQYCKSISIWAYGKNSPGILSISLQDTAGKQHRLIMGHLDFTGWKKLTVALPSDIAQMDRFIHENAYLTLKTISYHPGSFALTPRYIFIYIDDISATVRNKYLEKNQNEW